MLYVLLLSKRILIMKKSIWVFQYRESGEEDFVELFDKKPSRKYLDKLLYELLPFTFDHDDLTPSKQRLNKEDPVYYEILYKCEVNQIEEGAANGN